MTSRGSPSATGLWRGVLVAMTTPFDRNLAVDLPSLVAQARWLAERGVDGLVVGGSLGEGATLSCEEKTSAIEALAGAVPAGVALIAAVGAARTSDAVDLSRAVAHAGARALLVLPPYVYHGDARETSEHFASVFEATDLPCMLYNNPSAYGTDVRPEQILDLSERCASLAAVKESSGDVRRIRALRSLLGDRLDVAVGLDDAVLEGVAAGAVGWIAGLANALPDESVALFDLARRGNRASAATLFAWFLPLLRLDALPKFVQLIKLVESEVGRGSRRVRPPRRELEGAELAEAIATIRFSLRRRPSPLPAPGPTR